MADDPALRAQRRAFIRDHHPDRGGDPEQFVEGMRRLAGPEPVTGNPATRNPVTAYRSRRKSPARLLRRIRAKLAGTPPRRLT